MKMNSEIRIFTVFAHLLAKLPQPGDSQVTFSVCHLLLTYQFNHSNVEVEAILLSALPKDTTSELVGLFSHYPFNAECQAGKLQNL